MAAAKGTRICYGEADANASDQTIAPRSAGYKVAHPIGRKGVERALQTARFDVAILGDTLNEDDRHHLPYRFKKVNPEIRILVLHASGHHPKVDLVLDSRHGHVWQAVGELVLEQ